VWSERRALWTQRFGDRDIARCALVATDADRVVGFAYTILDDHPTWGALLDNLHVAHSSMRQGIGSRLLVLTAGAVTESRPGSGLHLWVLEQNVAAQAFYQRHGAACVERASVLSPGGDSSRLNGSPAKLRYAWADPARLARPPMAGD